MEYGQQTADPVVAESDCYDQGIIQNGDPDLRRTAPPPRRPRPPARKAPRRAVCMFVTHEQPDQPSKTYISRQQSIRLQQGCYSFVYEGGEGFLTVRLGMIRGEQRGQDGV